MLLRPARVALATLLCWILTAAAERPYPEDYLGDGDGDSGPPGQSFSWEALLLVFGPILVTGLMAERWQWAKWLQLVAWLWPIVWGASAALSR